MYIDIVDYRTQEEDLVIMFSVSEVMDVLQKNLCFENCTWLEISLS